MVLHRKRPRFQATEAGLRPLFRGKLIRSLKVLNPVLKEAHILFAQLGRQGTGFNGNYAEAKVF
nr:putative integron gene cassette protein [uncultured bacterium]